MARGRPLRSQYLRLNVATPVAKILPFPKQHIQAEV